MGLHKEEKNGSGSSVDGRSVKETPSGSAAITRLSSCANFLFTAYKWFTSGKGEKQSAIEPKSFFLLLTSKLEK